MAIPKPNIATAAKAKTTSAVVNAKVLAAAAKQSPLINPNQVQNQGTDGSSQGNRPRPGFEGPSPAIPEVSRPGYTPATADSQQATLNNPFGLVSKADAMKQLAGVGTSSTAAQSEKDKLTDLSRSSTTNQPSLDQGFGSQANVNANTVPGGNPMAAFQSASVGGPLAGSQAKTPEDFDKNGLIASGDSNWFLDWVRGKTDRNGDGPRRNGHDQIKPEPNPDPGPTPAPVPSPPEPAPEPDPTPDPARPAPENQGSRGDFLTQTILDQLRAAQAGKPTGQGGSGDATPVDDGGIGGVVRDGSIAMNQSSIDGRNLFGQPVGPGGENYSGGNRGLDGFGNSNGAGVINPGPEGGTPQGDGRFADDPSQATGGRQTSPNLNGGRDAGPQSDSTGGQAEDLLLTGTRRADTLRGSAGNDTLRGLAGNDILDGGAGRDTLTGGTGADRFRFSAGSGFGQAQADHITDFSRSEGDRIELSRSAFGLSAGAAVSFQSVNSDADLSRALGSSTLLVQDLRDGKILFNQNGSAAGVGQGGVFAVVSQGLTLKAGDFALGA